MKRIGVLTGGGDAPGLNPAIRAVVLRAAMDGIEVTGILDGWEGLLDGFVDKGTWPLDPLTVRTWDRDGGTHLGSSRTNPFRVKQGKDRVDCSDQVIRNLARLGIEALIPMGGEDTLGVANRLAGKGGHVVGVPKTIDKDLSATDYTLGFDTSLRTCVEIIEKSRTPAGSHHWVQVIEVMGRHAGHLAFWAGMAGAATMILIPEHPFDLRRVLTLLNDYLERGEHDRRHPSYAIVVIAEGATPLKGEAISADGQEDAFGHTRLGGIGAWLSENIRQLTDLDSRSVALGHPQRGGPPSIVDRMMGHFYGTAAVEAVLRGEWGKMVSARGVAPACDITLVPLSDAVGTLNLVDVGRFYDTETYNVKRSVLGV